VWDVIEDLKAIIGRRLEPGRLGDASIALGEFASA
jgi:hypothetical protein